MVGLAGGSASGKSLLASGLVEHLGDEVAVVPHDAYYRSLPEGASPHQHNFDHPDALETSLLAAHLDELRAGRSVRVPRYGFAQHCRLEEDQWVGVEPRPLVLVEGILVLADPDLARRFDLAIFVHAPSEVRLARRIVRDERERGRSPESVRRQFQHSVEPMHQRFVEPSAQVAELWLDGTAEPRGLVHRVLSELQARGWWSPRPPLGGGRSALPLHPAATVAEEEAGEPALSPDERSPA